MNDSARASRSIVDIPAFTSRRSIITVSARIFPPSAISSISRVLLSWITSPRMSLARQHPECARRHVLHRSYRIDDCHASAVLAIPAQHRRRLPLVNGEPVADRLRLVVLPTDERAPVLVALGAWLAPHVGRLTGLAHRTTGQPAHDLVVVDVEAED